MIRIAIIIPVSSKENITMFLLWDLVASLSGALTFVVTFEFSHHHLLVEMNVFDLSLHCHYLMVKLVEMFRFQSFVSVVTRVNCEGYLFR